MPLIVAIEPDRKQTAHLAALSRGSLRAEWILAETTARALAELGDRVPDLILTSALLPPKDEDALAERLRALDAAASHVQTLTIPVFASPSRRSRKSGSVLSRLTRSSAKSPAAPEGCDPSVFAGQIAEYLDRVAAERKRLELERSAAEAHAEEELTKAQEPSAAESESEWGTPLTWEVATRTPVTDEPVVPEQFVSELFAAPPALTAEPFVPEPFVSELFVPKPQEPAIAVPRDFEAIATDTAAPTLPGEVIVEHQIPPLEAIEPAHLNAAQVPLAAVEPAHIVAEQVALETLADEIVVETVSFGAETPLAAPPVEIVPAPIALEAFSSEPELPESPLVRPVVVEPPRATALRIVKPIWEAPEEGAIEQVPLVGDPLDLRAFLAELEAATADLDLSLLSGPQPDGPSAPEDLAGEMVAAPETVAAIKTGTVTETSRRN